MQSAQMGGGHAPVNNLILDVCWHLCLFYNISAFDKKGRRITQMVNAGVTVLNNSVDDDGLTTGCNNLTDVSTMLSKSYMLRLGSVLM